MFKNKITCSLSSETSGFKFSDEFFLNSLRWEDPPQIVHGRAMNCALDRIQCKSMWSTNSNSTFFLPVDTVRPIAPRSFGAKWFVLWTWLSWEWKHLRACLSEYLQTCDFIGTRPPWTRAVAQSGLRLLRLAKKKTGSRTPASSVLLPTLDTCDQEPPTPGALHSHSRSWRTFKRQVKTHSSLACACQVSQHSDRKSNQYAGSGGWVHEALWGRQRVFGVYDNLSSSCFV